MLKDVESEDAVKTPISKGELMRVAHDIGVFENLVLEFDASWVFLWRRTRTDVKDDAIAFAQDCLELSADLVGYVIGRNGDYVFLDEKRHIILDSVGDAASFALQPVSSGTQPAVAGGTTDKTGNALIHSTKRGGLHHRLMSISPHGLSPRTFHVLPHIVQTQTFSSSASTSLAKSSTSRRRDQTRPLLCR